MTDETVTVHVWQGSRSDRTAELLEADPDEYELTPDDAVTLADSVDHHGSYAFDVPNSERPATVNVYTNDSYHDATAWGRPIERGLAFHRCDDADPYGCELWGRVLLEVEIPDRSDCDAS